MGTHLNCIDAIQMGTHNICLYKEKKNGEKSHIVGTHLNCIDESMQFKCVPTIYAFINK